MIKLGDRITVKPATFDVPGKDGKPKGVPGTVVYIHPAGRYCVLEFEVPAVALHPKYCHRLSAPFAHFAVSRRRAVSLPGSYGHSAYTQNWYFQCGR